MSLPSDSSPEPTAEPPEHDSAGYPTLPADVMSLVYDELRVLARAYMAGERKGHTLQATALVHEAWGRLPEHLRGLPELQFKACMATAMRRVLVDHARAKRGPKRGGGIAPLSLDVVGDLEAMPTSVIDLLDLDEALQRLVEAYPVHARIVAARFFAGMTNPQIASALGIGKSTVEGYWRFVRAWLKRELSLTSAEPPPTENP
ncbi:MAG: RNA polymerase subunit sigma [Planctomycetes bacterium]|nr:RNA polymerase subunit sigma [Planctomycetota bacterium]